MKTLLFVIALALLVPALALSQTGATAPAAGHFTVTTAISIFPTDGDFGELMAGVVYTIAPNGDCSPATTIPVTPIEWDILGQANASVLVTIGLPAYFASGTGANVPYSVNAQSAGWWPTNFTGQATYNPIDPRLPNTVALDGGGNVTVELGGILAVPATANGDYTAQFVLTASYTGF